MPKGRPIKGKVETRNGVIKEITTNKTIKIISHKCPFCFKP
jgi:hypothetical protein